MGLASGATVAFYVVLVNMPTFAHTNLGLPLDQVLLVQMLAVALMTVVIPFSGALSDQVGRRPVLMAFTLAFFVMIYPLYVWVAAAPSIERLLVMQLLLCGAIGGFFGPAPTALAEQFPIEVRSTGVSIAYNISVMVFGGFAPLIVTWLSKVLETPVAPSFYVLFACLLTLLGIYCMQEAPRAKAPSALNLGVKS
jgi:MFS family permease